MGACAIQARSGMECPAASPPPNLIPAHLQPIFSKHSLEHRITSWFWAGGVLNSYKNILLIPAHLQPIFSKHSLEHRITSWFWAGGVLNSYKNILLIPAHLQPIFSKHSLEHRITSWFWAAPAPTGSRHQR